MPLTHPAQKRRGYPIAYVICLNFAERTSVLAEALTRVIPVIVKTQAKHIESAKPHDH